MALAAVVAVAGLIGVCVLAGNRSVERRLEVLRAAGYPTSFVEFVERDKLPDGPQNAARVYMRAFAAYVPPVDQVNTPLLGTGRLPDRGASLPEPMAKAISDCLASNQACLSLLHEAAAIEDCVYGWDWRPGAGPSSLGNVRYCGFLLELGAICESYGGDPNAVTRFIEDELRLADSLRREPTLISSSIRNACIAWAIQGLERSLSVVSFTDAQLRELRDAFAATAKTLDFTRVVVNEQWCLIETCRDPPLANQYPQSTLSRILPGGQRRALVDVLDCMGDYIEASKLPPTQRLTRFRAIEKNVHSLSFMHGLIRSMSPMAMSRVAELDLRIRAHVDLARTALAIERYRLAMGKVPERLEELSPQYLKEAPIDPFDGKPIRYRRTEPGYCLYSILEDGQDNGGRERSDGASGEAYDWCFIVTR